MPCPADDSTKNTGDLARRASSVASATTWNSRPSDIRACLHYRHSQDISKPWAAQPRGVGGYCPPTFEAKGIKGGTMKMMYSSQFRLYSGVRRGSILFHLLSVLELPGAGGFPQPRLWTPK